MTLPLFEETYTVSRLGAELKDFLGEAFGGVWVAGEVQRPRIAGGGHCYFELVEKGPRDAIVGRLEAVVWRRDYERVRRVLERAGLALAEGQEIRCRAGIDFYPAGGRLQLVVRDVDPTFTEGLLARRRRETLEALAVAGLLERNRALPWPALPLRIGLVTSAGSAAYHDFVATLRESGFPFRVLFVHTTVQGREAESQVIVALRALATRGVDCVVLARGGGSRADLAVFDARALAEAVACAPFPVITGLGHEIDESIADRVAHTAVKTPTKAAELLVESLATAERAVAASREGLIRAGLEAVRLAGEALEPAARGLRQAGRHVAIERGRVERAARGIAIAARANLRAAAVVHAGLAPRLSAAAPRSIERRRRAPEIMAQRLLAGARARLAAARAQIDSGGRLAAGFAPEHTLRRGYSITRRADGRLLTAASAVTPGERITTQLAAGSLVSRVEE